MFALPAICMGNRPHDLSRGPEAKSRRKSRQDNKVEMKSYMKD